MFSVIDRNNETISEAMIFAHVRRRLELMLEELPSGVSETRGIEAAIAQLAARLAYEQSQEAAARYLGGTSRSLRRGDLFQM